MPLLIMGTISVIGGLSGLRLPETLHYPLPQTVEEGEEFGKDWTITDCLRCVPLKYVFLNFKLSFCNCYFCCRPSPVASYEDLEMEPIKEEQTETTPLDNAAAMRRVSMKRLVRQQSVMDTQKDLDGSIKLTYWF